MFITTIQLRCNLKEFPKFETLPKPNQQFSVGVKGKGIMLDERQEVLAMVGDLIWEELEDDQEVHNQ